jgi:multidrug transporter EmrE-like cation transporter
VTKSIFLILLSISLAVSGQLLLKSGMLEVGRIGVGDLSYYKSILLRTAASPRILGGLALYGFAAVSWLIVLSRVDLSFAYPFGGLGYIAVLLVSRLVLDEPVGLVRWIGVFLIVLGILFISRS